MNTPSVSLVRASDYELEALQQHLVSLLAPLGGMAHFVKPGDRVLLKPNLLTGSRPTKECTTRPEIAYCVASLRASDCPSGTRRLQVTDCLLRPITSHCTFSSPWPQSRIGSPRPGGSILMTPKGE